MVTTLIIVDCQKDFHPGGSLAIPTANEDAQRIADFIKENKLKIDRIVATLDSHYKLHIGHPSFWVDSDGNHPTPFTIISHEDIKNGKWKPRSDIKLNSNNAMVDSNIFTSPGIIQAGGKIDLPKYCLEYSRLLEDKGRFQICIWPEHCIIGTPGHTVVDNVAESISDWTECTGNTVEYIMKGQNLLTEMYSVMEAEVPISKCTAFNSSLMNSLITSSDNLIVCGQAMSHCVNYSLRDIVKHWTKDKNQITLLTDCASAVPGFEAPSETFMNDMKDIGVQLKKSSEVFS